MSSGNSWLGKLGIDLFSWKRPNIDDYGGDPNNPDYIIDMQDYDTWLSDIRSRSGKHLQSWKDEYPAGGSYGQRREPVAGVSTAMGLAPVDMSALYGRPQAYPGIASIVNLKKKRS